jgi:rod shape determining protein RodA
MKSYSTIRKLNYFLITAFFTILIFGFYVQYSAASGNLKPFLSHQLFLFTVIGIPVFLITVLVSKDFYFKYSYVFFIITVILLLFVFLTGKSAMGATRWIRFMGINLQPAEFLKTSVILMLARYFSKFTHEDLKNPFFLLLPILYLIFPLYLILKQPSLGTFILISTSVILIYFIIGVNIKYFLILFLLLLLSVPLVWKYGLYDYQKVRILTFLKPEESSRDANYNILQSKIAIGAGGLYGKGLISGDQTQLKFLPERHTDFVLAVIAEELGFIFVLLIILCYLILFLLGIYISIKTKDTFSKILSFSISILFFLHFFINLSMISGFVPIVGMPLSIMSYGGSTMIVNLINFGILLRINLNNK